MIYASLLGGIGNLSFIIATTYILALENSDDSLFTQNIDSITHRKNEELWFKTIFRKFNRGQIKHSKIYREPKCTYTKIPYRKNMRLHGYFQSAQYFDNHREKIVDLMTNYKKDIIKSLNLKLSQSNKKKISIHVRRADYLKLQHAHVVLQIQYYKNAVSQMKTSLGTNYNNHIFYIFSDDIKWCKSQEFFKNLPGVSFIENSDPLTIEPVEVFQLYLMSMCDHNIIANSTFSWWGAYLNENPNKIVVSPKKWFNRNFRKDWNTLYHKDWLIV